MEDSNELIGEVSKNSQEVVKIHISTFKDKFYVDARIFVHAVGKDPGVEIATKRGLCLTPDLVLELLPLLVRARERAGELSRGI